MEAFRTLRWTSIERLGRDLRYGCRALSHSPGFTFVQIAKILGSGRVVAAGRNEAVLNWLKQYSHLGGTHHVGTRRHQPIHEHYETVAYWYGAPRATLVQTDELAIADAASEKAHGYTSPEASAPYQISSRYEWGVDTLDGREVFPPHAERGRRTRGTSEFTMKIDSRNLGVLLRRKLDYASPNQRAEVYIAGANDRKPRWTPAGVWYLAGSNTCVYSNPPTELGETQHIVQTSNRRFRDDEFLIPRDLTEGRRAIRIRIRFTPVNRPRFPG